MKLLNLFFIVFLSILIFSSFQCRTDHQGAHQPVKVDVRKVAGKYQLFRGGQPFYIKGAGGSGLDKIPILAEYGGNSIRTWNTRNAQNILDRAYESGVTVLMGLQVGKERHGFDYSDSVKVAEQLQRLRRDVMRFKDHPALLGWGIGNELNLHYTNKKVWNAVNDIARMIHEVDGNHPATTMLSGIHKEEVDYIKANCPDLDFLSIQMYGDIINLAARIEQAGWNGPFAVTEWGATGHWEVARTDWDVAIEQTSSEKARSIMERWQNAIAADTVQCLGSYVFLWGQKQERTPTWYGLFLETGEQTEAIDVMHKIWTGAWPDNRAPQIDSVLLDGKTRYENVRLQSKKEYNLSYKIFDPDNDALDVGIEILHESTDLGEGGDPESRPESVSDLLSETTQNFVRFKAPEQSGAYRIFIYIRDGHNHAATANVPFYVE
jgi:hypothetical protein